MGVLLVDRANQKDFQHAVSCSWGKWRSVVDAMKTVSAGTPLQGVVGTEDWLCNDGHGLKTASECRSLRDQLLSTRSGVHADNCPSCGAIPSNHVNCPYCGRYRGAVSTIVDHELLAELADFLGRANGFCIY